jgi:hypothetical protein
MLSRIHSVLTTYRIIKVWGAQLYVKKSKNLY